MPRTVVLANVATLPTCEPFCNNPCHELSGNVQLECGACLSTMACGPHASDYYSSPAFSPETGHIPGVLNASCDELLQVGVGARGRFGQSIRLHRKPGETWTPPQAAELDCIDAGESEPSDCGEPEATARLSERGYVVVRGLMPMQEATALYEATNASAFCSPAVDECVLTGAQLRARLPVFVSRAAKLLAQWETTGVATAAALGHGLRLSNGPRAARRVQVTSDATFARLQTSQRSRYFAGWHADNGGSTLSFLHRLWVLVDKSATPTWPSHASMGGVPESEAASEAASMGGVPESEAASEAAGDGARAQAVMREHTNVCLLPTNAMDVCDSPLMRMRAAPDASGRRGRSAAEELRALWDRKACCPALDVGDAIFYREEVLHRTQDMLSDRLGLIVTVDTEMPQAAPAAGGAAPHEQRCNEWAEAGWCAERRGRVDEYMSCACQAACVRAAAAVTPGGDTTEVVVT